GRRGPPGRGRPGPRPPGRSRRWWCSPTGPTSGCTGWPGLAGSEPRPVSPVPEITAGMRFADLFVHPGRDEVWGVRETRTGPAPADVSRDIVAVPLDGSAV